MEAFKEPVPTTDTISDVYAADASSPVPVRDTERWHNLIADFVKKYGHRPDFVARSPGRVNIIGEHIDYSLYDVLPTAIAVDMLIAVKVVPTPNPDGSYIKIANTDSEKFPSHEFGIPRTTDIVVDASHHTWVNYMKCGIKGSLKFLREKYSLGPDFVPASMEALTDGNVPPGGGLSSSAAFICSSSIAVLKANGHDVTKKDLLDLAVVSERGVGVYSGGCVVSILLPLSLFDLALIVCI